MLIRNNYKCLLIIAYLLLTIPLAYVLNLGGDEAYSLESTSGNLRTTFERAIGFESQAPLYFLFLNTWRNLDDSIFFARLFSVLAILAAIYIFTKLLETYLNSKNIIWYALLFAFNPLTVWAALEIRLYALLVFLSSLVIYLFVKRSDSDSPFYIRIAFVAASIIGIYTQYYFILLPVTLILIFMLSNGIKKSNKLFIDLMIILISCSPIPLIVMNQFNKFPKRELNLIGFVHGVKKLLQYQEQIALPVGQLDTSLLIRNLVRAIVFIIITSVIYSNRKDLKKIFKYKKLLPFYLVITGLLFAIAASIFIRMELLSVKHLIFLLPPWILFISLIANMSKSRYQKYGLIFILLFVYCVALANEYAMMAKTGDLKRISNYISKEEHAGQRIFIFPNTEYLIFKYYYKGLNSVFSIPRETSTTEYNIYGRSINSKNELDKLFTEHTPDQDTIWIIILPVDEYMDVKYNLELLEEYIKKKFDVLNERIFYRETKVLLLSKKK